MFFATGLVAYVVSLQLFRRYLHGVVPHPAVSPVLIALHALCIVAMYAGRYLWLNSWDAFLAPREVATEMLRVPRPYTVALLATMFLVVGVGAFATAAVGDKALAQLRRRR